MNFFIGITDQAWFDFFSSLPAIDEVNFWQPSRKTLSDNGILPIPKAGLKRSIDIDGFLTRDMRNICVDLDVYEDPRQIKRSRLKDLPLPDYFYH